jgi:hypothetical protein
MAGFFRNYLYNSNGGLTIQCRVSNFTVAAQLTAPVQGVANTPGSVSFGIPSRRRDFRGRYLILKNTEGTGRTAKTFYTRLGVLNPADFTAAGFADGATVPVNGVSWTVSGRQGENLK